MNFRSLYEAKLQAGELVADPAQQTAVQHLHALSCGALAGKRGVYLYGLPGRGKSMLMNLFYAADDGQTKRRVYFHTFMEELHQRMQQQNGEAAGDPLQLIAQDIAQQADILCFDEFYLTNIADAMFLGRFMQLFFRAGGQLCLTSNWAIDDLFVNGMNRHLAKPFIQLLAQHLQAVEVAGQVDYRTTKIDTQVPTLPLWFVGCGEAARYWRAEKKLELDGRSMVFSFADLCEAPLGREDYMQLATTYDILIVHNIPIFTADATDALLRFVTLVDIMYEYRRTLICTAAARPEDLNTDEAMAAVFARGVSRLYEMQNWPK